MDFEIYHPWILTALPAAVLLARFARRSLDPLPPARRRASVILRGLLYALIILAMADIRWLARTREEAVVWLVDVSRSVEMEAVEMFARFREQTPGGVFAKEAIVAFAGKARPADTAAALRKLPRHELEPRHTRLREALLFAQASAPPGRAKTVVLFSDGRSTQPAAGHGQNLAGPETRIHTFKVSPPDRPEVLVREVRAPPRVKEAEPFQVETEILSSEETPARIKIFRNGALAKEETVSLRKGPNRFSFLQKIKEDKLAEFTVAVEPERDTLADNNRLSALTQTAGISKALLVTDRPEQSRFLAWALKQEGILLDVRPATGAPTSLGDLQNYGLLIVDNVPATEMTRAQLELWAAYVRDFGGGFLMLGGGQAFGLGGYYRTPAEDILPVKVDYEKQRDEPALALVLVLDKSGSMTGVKIEMAKEAAKAAVELLSPSDFSGVAAFDSQSFWAADLRRVADKYALIQLISSIQAGGGTDMSPAMEMAYRQLSYCPAKLKHVILLTDGQSQPGPFHEITSRMAQEGITVSSVGVGQGADVKLLEQISRWGNGRFYYTEDPNRIPQIFAKETMTAAKSAIKEMPFQPRAVKRGDFLRGIDFDSAPFLYGYVQTESKPTAEVWLATEKGDPLLCTWRYGLGQAGAFASDARNRWAVEWLQWEGYGPFWAQVCRRLTRSESLRPFPASFAAGPDRLRLTVEAVDKNGEIQTGLKGKARLLGPEGQSHETEMRNPLPGQFTAAWPITREGNYHVEAELADAEGNVINRQYLTAAAGYPEEFLLEPPDEAALKELAASSGGLYNPSWQDLKNAPGREARQEFEWWPWLAGLAAGLFLADVALKRWP